METKIKCEKCKNQIKITSDNKKFEIKQFEVDGENLTVMYCKCAICGNIIIMQIDNEQTIRIRDTLVSLLVEGTKNKSMNKGNTKSRCKSLDKSLNVKRKKLVKKYLNKLQEIIDK